MAGDEGGVASDNDALFRLQRPQGRQTHRHQGRLGVGGQGQLGGVALEHQGRQLFAQRRVHLVENRARGGKGVIKRLAHSDGLRTLPWKKKCDAHLRLRPVSSESELPLAPVRPAVKIAWRKRRPRGGAGPYTHSSLVRWKMAMFRIVRPCGPALRRELSRFPRASCQKPSSFGRRTPGPKAGPGSRCWHSCASRAVTNQTSPCRFRFIGR